MRVRAFAAVVVAMVAVAACIPPPEGPSPLRYRDEVFPSVTKTSDLLYASAPDLDGNAVSLRLDLYQPVGDTVARRPAIVWAHGGGFCCGSKSAREMVGFSTTYAKRGYVAVSIDYRKLAPEGCGGPPSQRCIDAAIAAQHDAQAAVRWLRARADTYRIDTGRIAIGGFSAGAVTAFLVGTRSDDPGSSGNPDQPSHVQATVPIAGGWPTNEFIGSGDAPTIFFHGTEDRTVDYRWAVANAQALRSAGIKAHLHSFEGEGHGIVDPHFDLIVEQSRSFLWYEMRLDTAAR